MRMGRIATYTLGLPSYVRGYCADTGATLRPGWLSYLSQGDLLQHRVKDHRKNLNVTTLRNCQYKGCLGQLLQSLRLVHGLQQLRHNLRSTILCRL